MGKGTKSIAIIGGGLAGLTSAHLLAKAGLEVVLFEKKKYPFHRVCGEYVSNEVRPFLEREGLFPETLGPAEISRLTVTDAKGGQQLDAPLTMGAFGVSRFSFDDFLRGKAMEMGAQIIDGTAVTKVKETSTGFHLTLSDLSVAHAGLVIGAHGKRSKLDRELSRDYMGNRSPFLGVKYHVRIDYPADLVALHLFPGGYCGINKVENDTYNLCYLTARENLSAKGGIEEMERRVLFQNPHIHGIFTRSEFLFEKPEVINEVSFETKEAVYRHLLMTGDAAGMVAPLCGNGMAMAIRSAKMLSELVISQNRNLSQVALEIDYGQLWNREFAGRLRFGRTMQHLLTRPALSGAAIKVLRTSPWLTSRVIALTHGSVIS